LYPAQQEAKRFMYAKQNKKKAEYGYNAYRQSAKHREQVQPAEVSIHHSQKGCQYPNRKEQSEEQQPLPSLDDLEPGTRENKAGVVISEKLVLE